MSVYKRYFRVTAGPLVNRIKEIFAERDAAAKQWDDLCRDVGALSAHAGRSFAGLKFSPPGPEDAKSWKQSGALWLPKKSTTTGKALQQRIDALIVPTQLQEALKVVDLHTGPALIENNRWYGSTLCGKDSAGVWFVSVPWRDEDPQTLEQYQANRDAGTHMDGCLDHLLWIPPPEFAEVKRWQFEKEYEEIMGKAA
ncbi:hypothetical protein PS870_02031 [Pseudomonas fluorescens]|uniref:Uncharacterized protein n=1 Tax=Pseudomonas fluorescens TaxID=294 RepID=A0A5E7JBI4_PSEFL|nr:hypothetical protein [Pseudomonas fluorescens]VVO85476.1 hypothetical protein PS870_02031 [Pseudomonas fluorescens]